MTSEAPRNQDFGIFFVKVEDPRATAINADARSRLAISQHRHRRDKTRKETGSGWKEQSSLSPQSVLNDGARTPELHDTWSTRQGVSASGQTLPAKGAWKFVVTDPSKESGLLAKQELHAFLTTRYHRKRLMKLERSLSADQIPDPRDLVAINHSREDSSRTTPSVPGTVKRSATADGLGIVNKHTSPEEIMQPECTCVSPPILRCLEDPTDQLKTYAHQLKMSPSTIWEHYLWQEREHGRLFHAQYERYRGWAPKYLHPMILTDPAVLATTVLFTGCILHQRAGNAIMSPTILHLRSHAYHMVQSTIDQSRQPSDTTILAVVKLALFEVMFGQPNAYAIHMQGLVRMVHLRNGLSGLGKDGYLAHLLIWFDANLSAMMKTSRSFAGEVSVQETLQEARADEASFALGL